jgi:hypothetical protein
MPGLARIPYKKELNRGLDQRESAAGDDAFLDSGAGGGQRVLDLGGRADVDDPDRLGLAELADVGLLELEVDLLGDESFWTLINSRRGEMAMSSNIEGMQEGEHGMEAALRTPPIARLPLPPKSSPDALRASPAPPLFSS